MDLSRGIIRGSHDGQPIAAGVSSGYCWFTWSNDGGVTWEDAKQVTQDVVADEQPGLTEMDDGSLRIAVSQEGAVRIYASDGGESWEVVGVLT